MHTTKAKKTKCPMEEVQSSKAKNGDLKPLVVTVVEVRVQVQTGHVS